MKLDLVTGSAQLSHLVVTQFSTHDHSPDYPSRFISGLRVESSN